MKNFVIILSVIFSFTTCSYNSNENDENTIIGAWTLIKFEPGFSPVENFNEGKILWEFQKNGILNITIDTSISSTPIKSGGSYKYSLTGSRILIGNTQYDYEFKNSFLIISNNPSADGFRAEFSPVR